MDQPKRLTITPSDEAAKELAKTEEAVAPRFAPKEPATQDSADWTTPDPLDIASSATSAAAQGRETADAPRDYRAERLQMDVVAKLNTPQPKARRFLAAYITSILSALVLLAGASSLGYVLLGHFLTEKTDSWIWQYIDFAPIYLSTMTTMIVFGVLYLVVSQYVARQAANDTVGLRDWRAYRVVYAAFTAILVAVAASVVASLVYIPFALMFVADDLALHQISIQVLGGFNVLFWVGLLVWQERLIKNGKHSALQGVLVIVLAGALVGLTGVFPVGQETNNRFDKRVANDLSRIQSAITDYRDAHNGKLPASLDDIELDHDTTAARLGQYKYTPDKQVSSEDIGQVRPSQLLLTEDDAGQDGGQSYESYLRQQTIQKYKLCATFRTDTTKQEESPLDNFSSLVSGTSAKTPFTKHIQGEVCFDRT